MSGYTKDIMGLLGCSEHDAVMIEEIMRNAIFHSTLDWPSRAQFNRAARKAAKMLDQDRDLYEEWLTRARAVTEQMRQEKEAGKKAANHEV